MTKQTENKIGGVGIEWSTKGQYCEEWSTIGQYCEGRIADGSLLFAICELPTTKWAKWAMHAAHWMPMKHVNDNYHSKQEAKKQAQKIYDNFIWSGINKEQLKEMIREAYKFGYDACLDGEGLASQDTSRDQYADQYIKDTFGEEGNND